ncbi:hypothetical protein [Thalassospira sp. TSL5-1]|uniref:hypothetical protein n=1 Tax=Thalassospira sp. TSL5-1 TaxID=1544451 RepID=UPI00093F21F4|nr:hypothetical protein [Thalassospira sp. TSL5-1]OKH88077.1 hypothetical protein LF95_15495 [Thalassospira sp. TSL5-1]
MSKKATVTQAAVRRAIQAAKECGLQVSEVVVSGDSVSVRFGEIEEIRIQDAPALKEWPKEAP